MGRVLYTSINSKESSGDKRFHPSIVFRQACLVFIIIFFLTFDSLIAQEMSTTTQKAFQKFKKVDSELHNYGSRVSEFILNCSYLQDVWLAYLHDAIDQEEFYSGMQLFQDNSTGFQSVCKHVTTVFNFYTGESKRPSPQQIQTLFKGKVVSGFLNTFKLGRPLTEEERIEFFNQEYAKFLKDGIAFPFVLDALSIEKLEKNTLYNFALLQDGTIYASLERPGEKEYQVLHEIVLEAFKYPNHTMLAGSANQVVITAGALILHQVNDKRMFFISSKSGHFQPDYPSLNHMRTQLAEFGVKPFTVIPVPDIDMSRAVIKTYNGAQAPVLLTQEDMGRLFRMASDRWDATFRKINRIILTALSKGDESVLGRELTLLLKKQRAEATYMRSAYHLFTTTHQAPQNFGDLVKRFGKLKDAIKRYGTVKFNKERVQAKASSVLELIDKYECEMLTYEFIPADDASFHAILTENILEMRDLLAQKNLDLDEYHRLKKLSRETGALFLYVGLDKEFKGRGHLISRTVADGFFQANDLMAQTDYIHDGKGVKGEKRVIVPRKIANQINKYLSHLGIAPPHFTVKIDPKEAWWMINHCKGPDGIYSSGMQMRRHLNAFKKGGVDEQNFNYTEGLLDLKALKRDAEIAGNLWTFLDKSHQIPEFFVNFMALTDRMILAYEQQNFTWIKKEACLFFHLCYCAPAELLENWECTDQESFDQALQECLEGLQEFKENHYITYGRLKELKNNVHSFRDFINLNRRNGLFMGEMSSEHLPMVCFDALEERADLLLEEMEKRLINCAERILVTPEMTAHSAFIVSRTLGQ